MRKIFIILAFLASVAFAGNIEVKDAFVKMSMPHAKNTAIFLNITNNSDKEIKLLGATCPLTKQVELHTHAMVDGKMEMRQVKDIVIKPHSTVELKPGGLHIMLFNLPKPVTLDTKTSVKLNFDNKEFVEIKNIPAKEL